MSIIRVSIVEDELLVAESVAAQLGNAGFLVVSKYQSGEDALLYITRDKPDLVLMDIQLAGKLDGIETATKIKEALKIPIIYLTDHIDDETVERAKYTRPENYLSKPFNETDLIRAIRLAFFNISASGQDTTISDNAEEQDHFLLEDSVFIKDQHTAEKVMFDNILFLEAERAYCKIYTKEKVYTLSISMNKVSEQINHPSFVRAHRSYVVNLDNITGLEGNVVKLFDYQVVVNKEFRDKYYPRFRFIK